MAVKVTSSGPRGSKTYEIRWKGGQLYDYTDNAADARRIAAKARREEKSGVRRNPSRVTVSKTYGGYRVYVDGKAVSGARGGAWSKKEATDIAKQIRAEGRSRTNPRVKLPSKWTNAKVRVDGKGNVQIGLAQNPMGSKGGKVCKNVKSVKANASARSVRKRVSKALTKYVRKNSGGRYSGKRYWNFFVYARGGKEKLGWVVARSMVEAREMAQEKFDGYGKLKVVKTRE